MTSLPAILVTEPLAADDFSGFKRIVDVGGGRGTLLQAILHTNQAARGVLFDLPRVIADAARCGLGPRCELISGDFLRRSRRVVTPTS
jgi:spermidine synthase